MILKILKKLKMKFHQMKTTDVVRSIAFEIAEIAEIERFVDAVFSFVVVVVSTVYLIDFRVDILIISVAEVADADASTVALIAVTKFFVFDVVMNLMMIKN